MPSKPSARRRNEIETEYAKERPVYVNFMSTLKTLLSTLLTDASIEFHVIEGRAKEISSLSEKAFRQGKFYSNPLKEITDLCGVRIIVYLSEDVQRVCNLIKSEFSVDSDASEDVSLRLAPNEFGYRSSHLVIELNEPRSNLNEWRKFSGLKAEVQVRTVLQHAWASISHNLQYKHEEDVPAELRRRLFRLSGLLELADDEFEAIKHAHAELEGYLARTTTDEYRSLALDSLSLREFFVRERALLQLICEEAESAGFEILDGEELFEDDDDSLSTLVWACGHAGITTIEELSLILASVDGRAEYLDEQFRASGGPWMASAEFITILLVILHRANRFKATDLIANGWFDEIAARIVDVAHLMAPST